MNAHRLTLARALRDAAAKGAAVSDLPDLLVASAHELERDAQAITLLVQMTATASGDTPDVVRLKAGLRP